MPGASLVQLTLQNENLNIEGLSFTGESRDNLAKLLLDFFRVHKISLPVIFEKSPNCPQKAHIRCKSAE